MKAITSQRLTIRQMKLQDAYNLHAYRSNPEVVRYQSFSCLNLEESISMIQECLQAAPHQTFQLGIALRESDQLIGDCALKISGDKAEVGITISHHFQQRGFANEALSRLVTYLFDHKKVRWILGIADERNDASIRMLTSVGFVHQRQLTQNVLFKDEWVDEFHFTLHRINWMALQGLSVTH